MLGECPVPPAIQEQHEKALNEIFNMLRKIEKSIGGSPDVDAKPGILENQRIHAAKLDSIMVYIEEQKNDNKAFFKWIERGLITAGLGALALIKKNG